MRALGLLSLLLVVAIVGVLVKKQLPTAKTDLTPTVAATPPGAPPLLTGTPRQQVLQVQQAVQESLQAPRPMPDDK